MKGVDMEMSDIPRWVIVVAVLLIIVGFLAFARGRPHHRGDEVGSGSLGAFRASAHTVVVT
jgi:hypothetical protein